VLKAQLAVPFFLIGGYGRPEEYALLYVHGLEPVSVTDWLDKAKGLEDAFVDWFQAQLLRRPATLHRHRWRARDEEELAAAVAAGRTMCTESAFASMRSREDAEFVLARYRAHRPLFYEGREITLRDKNDESSAPLIVRHVREGVTEFIGYWGDDLWRVLLEGERREGCQASFGVRSVDDFLRVYGSPEGRE
jgi:hypothetical protein